MEKRADLDAKANDAAHRQNSFARSKIHTKLSRAPSVSVGACNAPSWLGAAAMKSRWKISQKSVETSQQ